MAADIEAKHFDLYVHPDETNPPFNTVAELLNAVLPFSNKIRVVELGIPGRPSWNFDPDKTHFFQDGIISLVDPEKRDYEKFTEGREQTYPQALNAIVNGVMIILTYPTTVKLQE